MCTACRTVSGHWALNGVGGSSQGRALCEPWGATIGIAVATTSEDIRAGSREVGSNVFAREEPWPAPRERPTAAGSRIASTSEPERIAMAPRT
jgi:hypothetical protein